MSQAVSVRPNGNLDPAIIESLVIGGDLSKLNSTQKVAYYNYRCHQAGLDPALKPFDLMRLQGKEILYLNAGGAQQLCKIHKLSPLITDKQVVDGIFCVTSRVTGDGRTTENMGAVPVGGLKGDPLANAMMKAITKSHRRTIIWHCGISMPDETEVDTIPGAEKVQGRGNPLRHEFAALNAEMDACRSHEQIDLVLDSPEFQDFEARDTKQAERSGMSYAGIIREKADQMKAKLPKVIEDKRKFVEPDSVSLRAGSNLDTRGLHSDGKPLYGADEDVGRQFREQSPNGGDPAPAAPESSPVLDATPEPSESEPVTEADRMEMDYLASIQSSDTQDELKRVRGDIEKDKVALGEQRFTILKKACVRRKTTIEAKETLVP